MPTMRSSMPYSLHLGWVALQTPSVLCIAGFPWYPACALLELLDRVCSHGDHDIGLVELMLPALQASKGLLQVPVLKQLDRLCLKLPCELCKRSC